MLISQIFYARQASKGILQCLIANIDEICTSKQLTQSHSPDGFCYEVISQRTHINRYLHSLKSTSKFCSTIYTLQKLSNTIQTQNDIAYGAIVNIIITSYSSSTILTIQIKSIIHMYTSDKKSEPWGEEHRRPNPNHRRWTQSELRYRKSKPLSTQSTPW